MKKQQRQAISLFSGAGGMDIGVRDAGFNILAEIEFDQHCCATLAANAEAQGLETKVIHADIRTIEPKELLKGLFLKGEELRCGLSPKDTTKYLRLHRKRPANTLRCGEIFYHPTESRYLTPREYMRVQGYPDSYIVKGPIRSRTGAVPNLDQHRQIANSVPPPLAKIMALQIKGFLDEQNI